MRCWSLVLPVRSSLSAFSLLFPLSLEKINEHSHSTKTQAHITNSKKIYQHKRQLNSHFGWHKIKASELIGEVAALLKLTRKQNILFDFFQIWLIRKPKAQDQLLFTLLKLMQALWHHVQPYILFHINTTNIIKWKYKTQGWKSNSSNEVQHWVKLHKDG